MDDSRIVDLYWERNERAIGETDAKYGRMLNSLSYSLLSSFEDAEECVNDTYLAAWNRMPTERPGLLGAFLAKIVRCISIDRYRASHREKRGGVEELTAELLECIPDSRTPERELENGRLRDTLNSFLYSLELEKRAIFVRRYFMSQPTQYIASQLGISDAKVKTTLCRMRAGLRDRLEKEGLL